MWLSGILLLVVAVGPLQAEEKEKADSGKEKSEAKAKSGPTTDPSEIDIPVPLGTPIKGIQIPHYGPDGKLLMMFDAATALKTDETHITLETLKIDAYSEDGQKIYIELPNAIFNLENRILYGDNNVLVRRDDFEITGKQGEFNTKTRFAKILGNVKMIIHNIDEQGAMPSSTPSPTPTPAQTP